MDVVVATVLCAVAVLVTLPLIFPRVQVLQVLLLGGGLASLTEVLVEVLVLSLGPFASGFNFLFGVFVVGAALAGVTGAGFARLNMQVLEIIVGESSLASIGGRHDQGSSKGTDSTLHLFILL